MWQEFIIISKESKAFLKQMKLLFQWQLFLDSSSFYQFSSSQSLVQPKQHKKVIYALGYVH